MPSPLSLSLSLLLILLTTLVSASITTPSLHWHNAPKLRPRASTNQTTTLAASELAAGLALNIMAQQGEVAATTALMNLMQAGKQTDTALYTTAKNNLLVFMHANNRIRANNMGLAGSNAQVVRGLAQIEQAQVRELGLANNLTGNAARDLPVLEALQTDFKAGIQKNRSLQGLATGVVGAVMPLQT